MKIKSFIFSLLFVLSFLLNSCNKTEKQSGTESTEKGPFAKIEFDKKQHDFGSINEGDTVKHIFKFKNIGEAPLVIKSVVASCGCTTPEWPKNPVAVGESGEILVVYNSTGHPGAQHKTITVSANTKSGTELLEINTFVNQKKQ